VDREREYPLEEAIGLLKSMESAGFDETAELAVRLGIDPRRSDQQVRTSLSLPHGTGRTLRVAVFTGPENADEAREAGAAVVGGEELIERVEQGWTEFDVALATPDMMRLLGRVGRFLGPRGLMPTPKNGTVREDIGNAVQEFTAGKVELRADSGGNVHAPVGKLSFTERQIEENVRAVLEHLIRNRPAAGKGRFLQRAVLSSTMGPGIKVRL
jgi:large subunit ribosomal protein L1